MGAISHATNCGLEGRMHSTGGELTVGAASVDIAAKGSNTIAIPCRSVSDPAAAMDVF
jgi:hypothetical protein